MEHKTGLEILETFASIFIYYYWKMCKNKTLEQDYKESFTELCGKL